MPISLNTKQIEELKQSKILAQKYELLINFNSYFEQYDTPKHKNERNLFEGCTVRTWLFEDKEGYCGYSESRLINGLMYLIIFNIYELKSINDILDFYDIGFFYSNVRIDSLAKVYDFLTM